MHYHVFENHMLKTDGTKVGIWFGNCCTNKCSIHIVKLIVTLEIRMCFYMYMYSFFTWYICLKLLYNICCVIIWLKKKAIDIKRSRFWLDNIGLFKFCYVFCWLSISIFIIFNTNLNTTFYIRYVYFSFDPEFFFCYQMWLFRNGGCITVSKVIRWFVGIFIVCYTFVVFFFWFTSSKKDWSVDRLLSSNQNSINFIFVFTFKI